MRLEKQIEHVIHNMVKDLGCDDLFREPLVVFSEDCGLLRLELVDLHEARPHRREDCRRASPASWPARCYFDPRDEIDALN